MPEGAHEGTEASRGSAAPFPEGASTVVRARWGRSAVPRRCRESPGTGRRSPDPHGRRTAVGSPRRGPPLLRPGRFAAAAVPRRDGRRGRTPGSAAAVSSMIRACPARRWPGTCLGAAGTPCSGRGPAAPIPLRAALGGSQERHGERSGERWVAVPAPRRAVGLRPYGTNPVLTQRTVGAKRHPVRAVRFSYRRPSAVSRGRRRAVMSTRPRHGYVCVPDPAHLSECGDDPRAVGDRATGPRPRREGRLVRCDNSVRTDAEKHGGRRCDRNASGGTDSL